MYHQESDIMDIMDIKHLFPLDPGHKPGHVECGDLASFVSILVIDFLGPLVLSE